MASSVSNADEVEFICTMLKVMTKHAKPDIYSYGIITPYAKQRTEIQNRLAYVERVFSVFNSNFLFSHQLFQISLLSRNSNDLSKHKIPVNTIGKDDRLYVK